MIKLDLIYRPKKSAGCATQASQGVSVKGASPSSIKTVSEVVPAKLISPKIPVPDAKFDKAAYQREYMRRYRAKLKAAKP